MIEETRPQAKYAELLLRGWTLTDRARRPEPLPPEDVLRLESGSRYVDLGEYR